VSRFFIAAALGGVLLLADCGMLDPYATTPRSAPPPPKPGTAAPPLTPAATAQRVGICYNTLTTALAEVQAQAQKECPADTTAEPADTDWYLQYCPLLLPARGTFACVPKK